MSKEKISDAKKIAKGIEKLAKEAGVPIKLNVLRFEGGDDPIFLSLAFNRKKAIVEIAYDQMDKFSIIDYSLKERKILVSLAEPARDTTEMVYGILKDFSKATLSKYTGINYPAGTKFEVYSSKNGVSGKTKLTKPYLKKSSYYVVAKMPETRQLFLVGFDEKHMFISNLNDKVNTVDEALASLIPKELRGQSYVRQGEFFFQKLEPSQLTEALFKKIGSAYCESIDYGDSGRYHLHKPALGNGTSQMIQSDHEVDGMLSIDDKTSEQYVIGVVKNPRHEKVFLSTLHRVFVANEQVAASDDGAWD